MRFILFNAIVAGALIYLFSGGDQPGADARQTVDDAMSRLAALSEQAVERVEKMQVDGPGRTDAAPSAAPPAPRRADPASPETAPLETVPQETAPQPQPAAAPDPVAEPPLRPAPAAEPAPKTAPATRVSAAAPASAQAVPATLPERDVATVPTHRVPKPGDTGPVAAPPAKGPIEIAEPMMSSQDRRKELFSLAQEMELMYATRVHE